MTGAADESPVRGTSVSADGSSVRGRHPAGDAPAAGVQPLTIPDTVPAIGTELSGLSEAHTAEDRSFLVDGGPLWVAGAESRPGFRVGEGSRLLAAVEVEGLGVVANVLLFPGVARRQSVGARGSVLETLVSAPRLPLVVAQWAGGRRGADGGAAAGAGGGAPPPDAYATPKEIVVDLAPPGGDAPPEGDSVDHPVSSETTAAKEPAADDGEYAPVTERHDDHVIVEARGRTVAVALSPEPSAIATRSRSDGGVRVTLTPSTDAPSSLLVAAGSRAQVRASLAAGRHARAHAARAAAGPQDGLRLRTGVPAVDDGFLWLRSRLAGQARRATSPDPALGLAAIAVGDREAAEALLAAGEATSSDHALLAARFASVLGDTGPAARVADHWRTHGPPEGHPFAGLAARALAEALEHLSHPDLIAAIRAVGTPRRPAAGGERRLPTVERRLPTVGNAGTADVGEEGWWRSLLSGDPSTAVPSLARPALVEAREACARFVTEPDRAWTTWRRLVSSTSEGRHPPTTLWDPLPDADPGRMDPDDADPDDGGIYESRSTDGRMPSLTAELLLAVTQGLLGLRADAAVGRLRLAPRLPSHVHTFAVAGIPLGSSSVGMNYRRDDGVHSFELIPERASVPPLLVFEPSVPGVVEEVRVDGSPADLELVVAGGRTTVPVQLPVDRPREVVFRT